MKKFIWKVAAAVCFFAVCSVVVTYAGIRNAEKIQNEREQQEVPATPTITLIPTHSPTPTMVAEQGIDLYGTYDENDLLIETMLAPREDDIEIEIPQINGLKDEEIQKKINQDMYNRIGVLLRSYPQANYGNYYVRGNFANVLSIRYHVGDGNRYDTLYLNYNLVTGERLALEDLFLQDADIIRCVRRAFYDMLAQESIYDMDMEWEQATVVSPDENQVYKLVKGYMESEKEFIFSPAEITFYYGNYVAALNMVDAADQLAVYSRFMTEESIFTRDDIGFKNAFTCVDTQYDAFEKIEYGYLEPNLWYDITCWHTYVEDWLEEEKRERYLAVKETEYASMYQKMEEYREIAKNNPDKFYLLFFRPDANVYYSSHSDRYTNIATISIREEVFEMPMEVFEETYLDKLIAAYRYIYFAMAGGAYVGWNEEDGVIRNLIEETKVYNYITGKELTEMEDLFYKYSGYMNVIKENTRDALAWKTDYAQSAINALADTLECRLDGICVYVTIPSWDDFYLRVVPGEFEDSMMKLFEGDLE